VAEAGTATQVGAERDDLRELAEHLSEEQVPAVLSEARRRLAAASSRPWPPAFFGAGRAGRNDVAERAEELRRRVRPLRVIVCDTGPIVAAALVDDAHHHECVELFTSSRLRRRARRSRQHTPRLLLRVAGAQAAGIMPGGGVRMGRIFADVFPVRGPLQRRVDRPRGLPGRWRFLSREASLLRPVLTMSGPHKISRGAVLSCARADLLAVPLLYQRFRAWLLHRRGAQSEHDLPVTAQGLRRFSTYSGSFTAARFIEFCRKLLADPDRPAGLVLRRLQKMPRIVRAFSADPDLRYITA
jgi:hypothetical protein